MAQCKNIVNIMNIVRMYQAHKQHELLKNLGKISVTVANAPSQQCDPFLGMHIFCTEAPSGESRGGRSGSQKQRMRHLRL